MCSNRTSSIEETGSLEIMVQGLWDQRPRRVSA